jgi:hypothetical protein
MNEEQRTNDNSMTILEKLISAQPVSNFPTLMESEISLLCSQMPFRRLLSQTRAQGIVRRRGSHIF